VFGGDFEMIGRGSISFFDLVLSLSMCYFVWERGCCWVEGGCGGVVGLEDLVIFVSSGILRLLFIGLESCRGGCLEVGGGDCHVVSYYWRLSLMMY
jgi:hypothetical protein